MSLKFRVAIVAGSATILSLAAQPNALAVSFDLTTLSVTQGSTSAPITAGGTTLTLSNPLWTNNVPDGIRQASSGVCVWAVVGTTGGRCNVNTSGGFTGATLTGLKATFSNSSILKSFNIGQFEPATGQNTIANALIQFKVNGNLIDTRSITGLGPYILNTPILLGANQDLEIVTSGSTAANNGGLIRISAFEADRAPAPGPLPLFGAGAAFGWSRKLRRRIQLKAG
jgi:hypothetical protein